MKITTRIISGFGLLIAVLAGIVIYQVITVRHMRDISRTLSKINFQNAKICLDAMSELELVDVGTRKVFATHGDPQYLEKLKEYREDFQKSLSDLKVHVNTGEEQDQAKRLMQQWDAYNAEVGLLQQPWQQAGTALPAGFERDLEHLKAQTTSVYQAILRSMSSKFENSEKTAETAVMVLWIVTLAAFVISILVSLLIVRSISKPLAHLTEGTRAIADGKFFYRLDTSRHDEFSQLARDFNKMTSRLNELDEMKKDFVSHVSHELKAPLASMRETIQIMLEEIPGPLTDKQKRLLELNLQSGTRLTTMIANLLDISKTEAGVMEYELKSQDLVPLVRNAIAELDVQAHERGIQLKADLPDNPLTVECDSDRIVQVLLNLVGNAVKFSPRHADVTVQVEKIHQIPDAVPDQWRRLITSGTRDGYYGLVTVSDSGPGIPDSDKEKVFEKFHQVRQGKKLAGQGVGLGLSICRTIVQAHRGAIWVEDNPGGGSRFMLLLRRGESGEEVTARASAPL
jgi:signal transduction histidine kinase